MTAKRYRKKPVVIEAIPYDGTNHREISLFMGILCLPTFDKDIGTPITIPTLEGEHIASVGDMIIKGVKGEFYPCKPDIFAETYEPADQNRRSHEMTDAPERIWAFYSNILGPMWTGVKDEGADEYIRADLAKAQAGALLRQAAAVAQGYHERAIEWAKKIRGLEQHVGKTDSFRIADDILSIDPDAQAALDRYVKEAVLSDPRVKALVEAANDAVLVLEEADCQGSQVMADLLAALRAIGGE